MNNVVKFPLWLLFKKFKIFCFFNQFFSFKPFFFGLFCKIVEMRINDINRYTCVLSHYFGIKVKATI